MINPCDVRSCYRPGRYKWIDTSRPWPEYRRVCAEHRPTVTCEVDGCGKPHKARRLCSVHYGREYQRRRARIPCTVDGCEKMQKSRGLCSAHYARDLRQRKAAAAAAAPLQITGAAVTAALVDLGYELAAEIRSGAVVVSLIEPDAPIRIADLAAVVGRHA